MSTKVYHDIMYFNPRPREEGDDWEANFPDMYDISIHALVKRATYIYLSCLWYTFISIHALVKRATYCDLQQIFKGVISIHALVKRATEQF